MKLNAQQIEIIEILEKDARMPLEDVAKMVGLSLEETTAIVKQLEDEKILVRYISLVDWTKVEEHPGVRAMIDVKVTPKQGVGFDDIAERIYRFDQVQSVYLMSGVYDLSVIVEGKSMNEVANFVSQKLSTLDSVISTTTHFILKKYKHDGTVLETGKEDQRIVVSP
ncbi:MAG: Lrp/AsnC family transcriptional regulator [Kurthia gibsonii]|uniref:Lrp/AsnC family transcriptional regulator n=1 Tax=Kurthia gibsonii TaxID=33946 RepID=A0ABU9LK51_9BACL|nr:MULTISPECIES: Lrp/AsnC family transcriptional regulator [Kurthia]MEB6112678.1 Lrp/AsnC family transcriptional regulator [Kurthia gibsonii]MEB7772735.1 Lrp/AsnC family transcriptional regulator [Kurthia gibsonii]RXH52812.1 Lrp/AsnC family transcriptional regulator [Kurthia gibsonii]WIL37701.1 Lrp/AsnC family transcriptional regulator [Kurthia sp. YJT4]HZG12932.1 Lrp/AsnC family transcriptional regulator [Kurthia gibsonii]